MLCPRISQLPQSRGCGARSQIRMLPMGVLVSLPELVLCPF